MRPFHTNNSGACRLHKLGVDNDGASQGTVATEESGWCHSSLLTPVPGVPYTCRPKESGAAMSDLRNKSGKHFGITVSKSKNPVLGSRSN